MVSNSAERREGQFANDIEEGETNADTCFLDKS